ncbi:MAG: hypothetical protein IKC07_01660, partial [Clostridia bacterium]|nr:hypothetical protein [Clostridia bacterium]
MKKVVVCLIGISILLSGVLAVFATDATDAGIATIAEVGDLAIKEDILYGFEESQSYISDEDFAQFATTDTETYISVANDMITIGDGQSDQKLLNIRISSGFPVGTAVYYKVDSYIGDAIADTRAPAFNINIVDGSNKYVFMIGSDGSDKLCF